MTDLDPQLHALGDRLERPPPPTWPPPRRPGTPTRRISRRVAIAIARS